MLQSQGMSHESFWRECRRVLLRLIPDTVNFIEHTRELTRLKKCGATDCLLIDELQVRAGANGRKLEPNVNYHVFASLFLSHLRE